MTHKFYHTALALMLSVVLITSCKKNDTPSIVIVKNIDPGTQPSELSRAFKVKDGVNKNGSPSRQTTSSDLLITKFQPTALITADNYLFVPFIAQTVEGVATIYFQVVGADNYWEINAPLTSDRSQVLNIEVPANVLNGNFEIAYGLNGISGGVGQPVSLKTQVISPIEYCSNGKQPELIAGNDGLVSYSFTFGDQSGWLILDYNTYTIPDRMDVRYNGEWIASTGNLLTTNGPPTKVCSSVTSGDGFVGESKSFKIYYDGTVSKKLDVYVSGCLEGGTKWDFKFRDCPKWYAGLPDCPCEYNSNIDEKSEAGGTWRDFSNGCFGFFEYLDVYHYGAKYEIRWAKDENSPGQQCTYNENKKLITEGIAAGSPDHFGVKGPCSHNSQHVSADVDPWKAIPCWKYLTGWTANKGLACQKNIVSGIDHMLLMIGDMTCEEATLLIRSSKESADINTELRSYILGHLNYMPTSEKLKSELSDWKKSNTCGITSSDDLCKVIDKAISNLK